MKLSNLKKRVFTSLILLLISFLMLKYNFVLVFIILILSILSLLEFFNIIKKIINKKIFYYSTNILFISYVFLFSFFFIYLSYFFNLKIILFIFLFGCIASDIGGFVFGKLLGGPKLTKISPNKTVSGAFGSVIFSSLTIFILVYLLSNNLNYSFLILGVATSIGCQLGDLFFSFLKRKAKIKDTGNFLPGHGGILDRVDSILLGLPIGLIALIFYNQ